MPPKHKNKLIIRSAVSTVVSQQEASWFEPSEWLELSCSQTFSMCQLFFWFPLVSSNMSIRLTGDCKLAAGVSLCVDHVTNQQPGQGELGPCDPQAPLSLTWISG